MCKKLNDQRLCIGHVDYTSEFFQKLRRRNICVRWVAFIIFLGTVSSFVTSGQAQAATWYVRADGGDNIQCTGKADAPYPGSGTNQPCGFKHPFFLFTDTTSTQPAKWVIASGDSVIIKNGSYRIGQDIAPGGNALWPWCGADQSTCGIPPPPSGTAAAHTRILGESWASCATAPKPELWGAAVYSVLTLTGSSFVDIQCLDITDHANCSRVSAAVKACNDATAPLDNYADNGINIAKATNVVLQDLDLHGLGYAGIKGNPNGATLTRLHVAGNSGAGIDFDPGDNSPSSGTITMSYVTVEWNGCVEQYPTKGLYGACTDEDSGGYGDGVGTPDTSGVWSVDHSMFRYNTQDGLDLLHVRNAAVTVTDSAAYGNIGNQFKVGSGSPLIFRNNYAVSNCWTGFKIPHPGVTTSDYNKTLTTYCRAEGTPIVALISPGSQSKIQNNSIAGHTDILIYLACSDKTCLKTSSVNLDNNIFCGFNVVTPGNTNPPEVPLSVYLGDQDEFGTCCVPITNYMTNPGGTKKDNMYFMVRDREVTPEMVDASDRYVDPALVAASDINAMDLHLTSGSPAIRAGINIPAITHDYDQVPRPAGAYDLGAFGYNGVVVPVISVNVTPSAQTLTATNPSQQFTATVVNSPNQTVSWSFSPAVGTLSATGFYTAPSSITTQQVVTIKGTAAADPTKYGTATVTLQPANAALSISGITVTTITSSTAMIGWATNIAANGKVDYGITSAYGSTSGLNPQFSQTHSVALAALLPGTLYHYRITSADAAGYSAVSPDAVFTTSPIASSQFSWTVQATQPRVTVQWKASSNPTQYDSIGLCPVGQEDYYCPFFKDTGGAASGMFSIVVNAAPGSYEFRYYKMNASGNLSVSGRSASFQL